MNKGLKYKLLAATIWCATLWSGQALAQMRDKVVKIGVLTDMSGVFSDVTGKWSVEAVKMAIEDVGSKVNGVPIELLVADHQNKTDVGLGIARAWFDVDNVDVIVDVPGSAIALAVQDLARERDRVLINTGSGGTFLSGVNCSPTAVQWTYDTYSLAQGLGIAGIQKLGDTWFFVTVDYSFGQALEHDISAVVTKNGGKVVGTTHHPLGTSDFSSYLLSAQASNAKVVAFANSTTDTVNAVKQAHEFGMPHEGQSIAAPLMLLTDLHALGLEIGQGLYVVDAFNADRDDDSRRFVQRYLQRTNRMPTMIQAAAYSAVGHYLKAIERAKTDEAMAVMKEMRAMPVNDAFAKGGIVRADGRMEHDMYLMQVKKPSESKNEWDLEKVAAIIPGAQATRPLSQSDCPLVKH